MSVPSARATDEPTPMPAPAGARRRAWLASLAMLAVFGLAAAAIHHLMAQFSYAQIAAALAGIERDRIALAVAATGASYLALGGYDWTALRYVGRRLPLPLVAFGAFCTYAIGNTVGLSLLSGGSIRYRVYGSEGLDAAEVARITVFAAGGFGLGLVVIGALSLLLDPAAAISVLPLSAPAARALGAGALALVAALLVALARRRAPIIVGAWRIDVPPPRLVCAQILVTVVDLAASGLALYALLPPHAVPLAAFLLVYALALVAGIASHVPGGLGVFETVMLLGLGPAAGTDTLAAALVAYRIIYYALPLVLATLLLIGRELRAHARAGAALAGDVLRLSARLTPVTLATLTFAGGAILIASAATPSVPERLSALSAALPLAIVEISHLGAAATGLALLLVARGLYRRLNGAWVAALALLAAGALFALAKGLDYEEVLALIALAGLLVAARREFHRRTAMLDSPPSPAWLAAVAGTLTAAAVLVLLSYRHVAYDHALWLTFDYEAEASRVLRAGVTLIALTLLACLRTLLRPPRVDSLPPGGDALARVLPIIRAQDRTDANLALLGDKSLLLNDAGDAFVMYGVRGSSWIAMGDPVGPPAAREDLAWRLRELADSAGGRVAFYQAHPALLSMYLDMGLTALKLGEEAIVRLARFDLAGSVRSELRYALRRGERDGLTFEIVPATSLVPLLPAMQALSDTWLAGRQTREKRFSIGAWSPAYVSRFDAAIVRGRDGGLLAFATLWTTGTHAEASIDLMRHLPGAPPTTMLYLFVQTLLHFRAAGYGRFTLGMAPLAGLEARPLAPLWHRVGSTLHDRGERYYGFRGLRQFKQKFAPDWEPRYLATPGGLDPVLVLIDAAALIAGGVTGVIAR